MSDSRDKNAAELDAMTFEEVVGRLEDVVRRLEEGDLPLEESLQRFEEGVRLARAGSKRLDDAEARVERLLAQREGVALEPLGDES